MDTKVSQELARLSNLITALLQISGNAKTLEEAKEIARKALARDQEIVPPAA